MNTTLQHLAIRPFIGLLAAFVLAASAVVAVSAETHAGKAPPVVTNANSTGQPWCKHDIVLNEVFTVANADFDLSDNKGKWIYVESYARFGVVETEHVVERVLTGPLNRNTSLHGSNHDTTAWTVTVVNRKGVPIAGPKTMAVSPDAVCPVVN